MNMVPAKQKTSAPRRSIALIRLRVLRGMLRQRGIAQALQRRVRTARAAPACPPWRPRPAAP
jgi:hypothetical protein